MTALGRRFGRDTAWMLLGTAGSAPLVLLASVLLARGWTPEDNGRVQAFLTLLTVLATTAQLGVATAVIVRIATGAATPARAATSGLWLTVASGGGVGLALWTARDLVAAHLLAGADVSLVALLAAALPVATACATLGALARSAQRFSLSGAALFVQQGGRVVAVAALAALLPATALTGASAVALPFAVSLAFLLPGALAATGIERAPDPGDLRSTLAQGLRTFAVTTLGQLHERLDVLLLALLRDPAEVAVYAVAAGIANRLQALPLAMSAALLPRLGAGEDDRALTAAACRRASLATIGAAAAVAVASPSLPWVFGVRYGASVVPLLLLLPATVAWAVVALPTRWFQARDRQGPVIVVQLVGLAVNLAANAFLIPRLGATGAALSSLGSYLLQAALLVGAFLAASGLPPRELLPRWDDLRVRS